MSFKIVGSEEMDEEPKHGQQEVIKTKQLVFSTSANRRVRANAVVSFVL
ncbi:MAG: hypothetical protein AAGA66_02515 [Bacteroidota bacterium]